MFSSKKLVALTEGRGFFTPTLAEIEADLAEIRDCMHSSRNTYYGYTTGAMGEYRVLKALYEKNA
jgi:hypothetical protein